MKKTAIITEDAVPVAEYPESIQQWILVAIARAQATKRWGKFARRYRTQNVLQHIVEQFVLTDIACAIETKHGKTIDQLALLRCVMNHDLGEQGAPNHQGEGSFDTPWTEKQGGNKKELEEIERQRYLSWIKSMPTQGNGDIGHTYLAIQKKAYELQYHLDTPEGKLFNALERLGYVMHMLEEVEWGHGEYIEDILKHHDALLGYEKEFVSIKKLYALHKAKVVKLMESYPG